MELLKNPETCYRQLWKTFSFSLHNSYCGSIMKLLLLEAFLFKKTLTEEPAL